MRRFAGIFTARPHDHSARARLADSLHPHRSTLLQDGPLQLAFTGGAAREDSGSRTLCLLSGVLDNEAQLRAKLGWPANVETADEGEPVGERLLAEGYSRWGRGLLEHLRGDFALLLWDPLHRRGLLARDQLGVGSLYLHDAGGALCFAGELHELLRLLPARPAPDATSVAHWITASNRPGPQTLYEGVRRLNPGSLLELDERGTHESSYWRPSFVEPRRAPSAESAEQLREAISLAVRRRLDAAGGTGVLMSGGLDSASVAAFAAHESVVPVTAHAGVFPGHPDVDESQLIDELRGRLTLGGITAAVRPGGLLASAIRSVEAWQAPLLGWSDFWTLPLLRAAADSGTRTILGGDGGDELFGARGYLLADRLLRGDPSDALRLAVRLPGAGNRPPPRAVARIYATLALAGAVPYGPHEATRRTASVVGLPAPAPTWMRPAARRALRHSQDPLAWKRLDGPRWWAHTAHGLTCGIEETGVFEHQRRRASLAGLRARHPLFDLDLVELCLRQPPEASFDPHRNRPQLRAAMAGLLPDSVRLRPGKAWFDSLVIDCLTGADGPAVRALLGDPHAELGAYVDLRRLRDRLPVDSPPHGAARFSWMHRIWRLLTAECWLRLQARPDEPLPPGGVRASNAHVILDEEPRRLAGSYLFPP
ncbi:MAG TPA: asparagine synthase-related protein [Solirubrobacteraceae bacterium]|jgi:asparagine synthase (glutamine-hydrolysing)